MRKRKRSLHIKQVILLLCLIVLSTVVLIPFQSWVRARVAGIRNQMIADIQKNNNILVKYENISASIVSVILIRGLEVHLPEGEFVAGDIRLFYNPFRYFWMGNDVWQWISSLSVSDGYLKLRFQDSVEREALSIDPWTLIEGKTLKLSSFLVDMKWEGGMEINSGSINATVKNGINNVTRYELSTLVRMKNARNTEKVLNLETRIVSSGRFSPEKPSINGQVDFKEIELGAYSLKPIIADFTYLNDELTVRRLEDEEPLDISLHYSRDSWVFEGKAEGLELRKLIAVRDEIEKEPDWLNASLTGAFSFSGNSLGVTGHNVVLEAAIDDYSSFGDIRLTSTFKGNNRVSHVEELELSSANNSIFYKGDVDIVTFLPEGELTISSQSGLLGYPAESRFEFERSDENTVLARPVSVDAGNLMFDDFRFILIREEQALAFSLRVVPQQIAGESAGILTFDALADFSDVLNVKGFLRCDGLNLGNFTGFTGVGGAILNRFKSIKDSRLNLKSDFEYGGGLWSFHLEDAELNMKDGSLNGLFLRGRGNQDILVLDFFRFTWNDVDIVAYGEAVRDIDGRKVNGNILVGNELYSLNADWYDDGRIEVEGDGNISLSLGYGFAGGRRLEFSVKDFNVPLPDGIFSMNLGLQGRKTREGWNISVDDARLAHRNYSNESETSLGFTMNMTPEKLTFRNILIEDAWGSIWGTGSLENYSNPDGLSGIIRLDGPKRERYSATIARSGKLWNVGLEIYQARLERIAYKDMEGSLTVKGGFVFGGDESKLDIDLWTEEGYLNDYPLQMNASVSADSHSIRVREFDFIHPQLSLENAFLLLDTERGRLMTTGSVGSNSNNTIVSSGFSLVSEFDGAENLIDFFSNKSSNYKGVMKTKPVIWNGYTHFPAFIFNFEKNTNALNIQTSDKNILDARYRFEDGGLYLKSNSPLPIVTMGEGYLHNGNIDFTLNEINVDSTLINYIMPRDPELNEYYVLFREGRFRGTLRVTGEAGNPDINGLILAEQLLVDTPYTNATIKPASTIVEFSDKRINFSKIKVDVGEGVVYGSGYMELENWGISNFDMVYGGERGKTGKPVPAYYRFDDIRVEGRFTGEMSMKSDGRNFFLEGDFVFPTIEASLGGERRERKEPSPVRNIQKRYANTVNLNLNLTTGNNCTFFLPNEQLKIVQATAEVGQVVKLVYSSNPEFLSIAGELKIKRGDIRYFDRNFQIVTGSLNLDESLQEFNPILDLRAETRIRDEIGEDVDVGLVYNAPVMSDFNPRVETIPPRTDLQTAALLGQIVVPFSNVDEGSQGTNSLLLATGSLFEQVGLIQPVEQALREGLNLDIVSVRTNIIGNALAESLYNNSSGSESSNLARFLDNTSLFLGKYVSKSLFVSGSVVADYFGGENDGTTLGGLKFTPKLVLEMETPIFNVSWSYSPDPTEVGDFVSDNKISLSRRFTF